ncbi:MAG: cysteine hydrolase [Gemmatimonadota bacterium]|jgi:nicotinamidase-related amidase|nr:cysteine hydrolase [Gemmatimonadota bacterium]
MADKDDDLHGNAPDTHSTVLLLVDVISDLEFPGGDALLAEALPMARRLAALKRRARELGVPVVYVNDNWGRWRSDLREMVRHCLEDDVRGRPLVELLRPDEDDYFVLKPKHSGFFSTTLDTLLEHLGAERLIITGLTGEQCVFFTASDAYMRDFRLVIPPDCVASADPEENEAAIRRMGRLLHADLTPSEEVELDAPAGAAA